jgi:hypothetical protein
MDGMAPSGAGPADHTLRISTGLIEPAPDHIVSTTRYNGQLPGPVIGCEKASRRRPIWSTTPTHPNRSTGTVRTCRTTSIERPRKEHVAAEHDLNRLNRS